MMMVSCSGVSWRGLRQPWLDSCRPAAASYSQSLWFQGQRVAQCPVFPPFVQAVTGSLPLQGHYLAQCPTILVVVWVSVGCPQSCRATIIWACLASFFPYLIMIAKQSEGLFTYTPREELTRVSTKFPILQWEGWSQLLSPSQKVPLSLFG